MSSKHWRGPTIPGPGDDLLQAWDKMVDTSGVVMVASSIASARAAMSTAAAAGTTISAAYPAYFDINGIMYRADGSKGDTGAWRMQPVNEIGRAEDAYTGGKTFTKGPNVRTVILTSSLGAAPYSRAIFATGMLSGAVQAGGYRVGVGMQGSDWQDAAFLNAFDSSGSDIGSATAINLGYVGAGVDPKVQMSIISGAQDTNRLDISDAARACKLVALAFPVTMA